MVGSIYLNCFMVVISAIVCSVAHAQLCPSNANPFFTTRDDDISLPLTVPLCIACRFFNGQGDRIQFNDGVWTLVNDGTVLTNGSFNGNVTLTSNDETTAITLTYPDTVVNAGDQLRCTSASLSRNHLLTIETYSFLPPLVSPNGTVDVTEGSNITLTCSNPGNSGSPRYVWINDTDGTALNHYTNILPLTLTLNNINRIASGNYYTCRTSNTQLPGVFMITSVTLNVQYLDIPSITANNTVLAGSSFAINCTFIANPPVNTVIWYHNGTVLNANHFSHIATDTQPTYSLLIFFPIEGLRDSGDYYCNVSNTGINSTSSSLAISLVVFVRPYPVTNLMVTHITNTSVMLSWSLSFTGNIPIISVTVNYTPVNGDSTRLYTGAPNQTKTTLSNLAPYTNYSINVVAVNQVGSSDIMIVYAQTLPLVPSAPTLNSVQVTNSTSLSLSWTNNRNSLMQSPVNSYRIVYYIYALPNQSMNITVTSPVTIVILSGLKRGTQYTVQVYATNSAGESTVSNSITAKTSVDPPSSVTNITYTSYINSICISWSLPVDNGGENISEYHIYLKNLNNSTTNSYMTVDNTSTSLLLDQLNKLTLYQVTIAAITINGGHGMNSLLNISTTNHSKLIINTDISITVTDITQFTAVVNWTLPVEYNTQSVRLQYRSTGMDWSSDKVVISNLSFITLNSLTQKTNYQLRIIVGNCLQESSHIFAFTTQELSSLRSTNDCSVATGVSVVFTGVITSILTAIITISISYLCFKNKTTAHLEKKDVIPVTSNSAYSPVISQTNVVSQTDEVAYEQTTSAPQLYEPTPQLYETPQLHETPQLYEPLDEYQ